MSKDLLDIFPCTSMFCPPEPGCANHWPQRASVWKYSTGNIPLGTKTFTYDELNFYQLSFRISIHFYHDEALELRGPSKGSSHHRPNAERAGDSAVNTHDPNGKFWSESINR
ncbi:hypothetical protein EVAR_35310_1 [Eumeta japonica]|uniref:Uncharacterized protein n=1 Tax=Eumeta variegata TaxID=151549 RepID=A0A4C1XJY0_EUMVA|nr:hypothetical protein EVAR_35310_1 [Eumeta japonica]